MLTLDLEPQDVSVEQRLEFYDDALAPMRAMLALDAGEMGSWAWDLRTDEVTGDAIWADLFNLDYAKQPWTSDDIFSAIHEDDLAAVQKSVEKAFKHDRIYEIELRIQNINPETGKPVVRWLGARGNVTERNAEGEPLMMIGVNWDATQKRRLKILAREMDHRVKNAFAVMRAIINIAGKTSSSKEAMANALKAQVEALAHSHDVSARVARNTYEPNMPVPLDSVIVTAFEPWQNHLEKEDQQIDCDIDPAIELAPSNVAALSMMIHELLTNAVKYGALSHVEGRLSVKAEMSEGNNINLVWVEDVPGGIVVPETSDQMGFGATLIKHCTMTLRGTVEQKFLPSGLHLSLSMPAAVAQTE